jgi:ABC-type spermidine/putrescine transport system permease subunit II
MNLLANNESNLGSGFICDRLDVILPIVFANVLSCVLVVFCSSFDERLGQTVPSNRTDYCFLAP